MDELKTRLAAGPVQFRLVVQLPNPGDPTKDPSLVWPDDRKTVEAGLISLPQCRARQRGGGKGAGIFSDEPGRRPRTSDDPLPALRSEVYALSEKYRRGAVNN